MPTWTEILSELAELQSQNRRDAFDIVRRKYLYELQQYTGRNTILYASRWSQTPQVSPDAIMMMDEDIQGLMTVFHELPVDGVDLIIHLPGGSAEVTEAMVSYIRSKFSDVRVIIPQAAMSAATMLACSANKIMMGKHSFIGPIDPQRIITTQLGSQSVPVQAILDQFHLAKQQCQDPKLLGAWLPMLSQYGPALLVQCTEALDLSKELVSKWLAEYMFGGDNEAQEKADSIANKLADHKYFKTHSRHIDREQARSFGLNIDSLEDDQTLQDLVLSVFHATTHTFTGTAAVKIIENHLGIAYIKLAQVLSPPVARTPQQAPPSPEETPNTPSEEQ